MAQTRRHMFLCGSVPTRSRSLSIYCHCFTASCWDPPSISAPLHFLFPPSTASSSTRPTTPLPRSCIPLPFSINYGQSLFHMNPLSTMGTKQMCVSELDGATGPGAGEAGGGVGERLRVGCADGERRRLWNEGETARADERRRGPFTASKHSTRRFCQWHHVRWCHWLFHLFTLSCFHWWAECKKADVFAPNHIIIEWGV